MLLHSGKAFSDVLHNEWNGIYLHFVNQKEVNNFGYETGHNKLLYKQLFKAVKYMYKT